GRGFGDSHGGVLSTLFCKLESHSHGTIPERNATSGGGLFLGYRHLECAQFLGGHGGAVVLAPGQRRPYRLPGRHGSRLGHVPWAGNILCPSGVNAAFHNSQFMKVPKQSWFVSLVVSSVLLHTALTAQESNAQQNADSSVGTNRGAVSAEADEGKE